MAKRKSKLAESIHTLLSRREEVTKLCWGGIFFHKGSRVLKVSNGTPGLLQIQICEPTGRRDLHVYTRKCKVTEVAVREFGEREHVPVR